MGEPNARGNAVAWAGAAVAAGAAAALAYQGLGTDAIYGALGLVIAAALTVWVAIKPVRGLYAILLALPLDAAGTLITSPVAVTVFHLALLLTLLSWAGHLLLDPTTPRPRLSVLDAGIAALLAAAVWSLPFSLDPRATVVSIVRLVFLWLFFLAFANLIREERVLDRVTKLLVATAVGSGLLAVAQYRDPSLGIGRITVETGPAGETYRRPGALFDDPNYLATFLSVGAIAAVARAFHARRWRDAGIWLAAAGACVAGLLVTSSRTGLVGVALGMVPLVLTAPRARVKWLATACVTLAVAAFALAPGVVMSKVASITDVEGDTSLRTRYLMAASTAEMIAHEPIWGTGLGAFEVAYPAYRRPGALLTILRPHQLPLAMWAEMGLPGLLAEILIIGGVYWVIRKRRHGGWNVYEALGVAGLLAVLLQSLFQYYLYFEYMWLFLALTAVASRLTDGTEEV